MAVNRGICRSSVEMRSFDVRDFAPGREFRRSDVAPSLAFVLRELDESVVGAGPDFTGLDGGRRNGVNDAAALPFRRVRGGCGIEIGWHARIFAGQVGTDGLPGITAVGGAKQELRAEIQHMRIAWRKYERQGPGAAELFALRQTWREVQVLLGAQILARNESAVHNVRICGIGRDVAVLVTRFHRAPIVKIQRAISSPAGRSGGAAILLGAVDPVGEAIVRCDVIELPGWLVEPRAPGLAAISGDDGALVAAEDHASRLVGIDP